MAFVTTYRPQTGGGSGPSSDLIWANEVFTETDPWDAGDLVLTLAHSVAQSGGIFIVSQGTPVYPEDYTFIAPDQIQIDFGGNPALTNPETGTWTFYIQYQYAA